MTKTVHVKMLSEDALTYLKKNLSLLTTKIVENDDNNWLKNEFPQPMFIEKKYSFNDFGLKDNPDSQDKNIDFENSVTIYENLKDLPRYILCDERFWLWLHFDKFYQITKRMMRIRGESTVRDHWLHGGGTGNHRRGLMFGVLSRLYFRVELSVDESKGENKYELTKWVIDNPERFRNLTWRSFSSQEHLVRGVLRGERKAIDENPEKENNDYYPEISKYVSVIGSVRLLDKISDKDIETMIYEKMVELISGDK